MLYDAIITASDCSLVLVSGTGNMQAQEQERKPGKLSGILFWFRLISFTLLVIVIFFSAFFFITSSTNSANTFWGAVFAVLAVILAAIQIIPIVFAPKSEPATLIQHFHLSSSSPGSAGNDAAQHPDRKSTRLTSSHLVTS